MGRGRGQAACRRIVSPNHRQDAARVQRHDGCVEAANGDRDQQYSPNRQKVRDLECGEGARAGGESGTVPNSARKTPGATARASATTSSTRASFNTPTPMATSPTKGSRTRLPTTWSSSIPTRSKLLTPQTTYRESTSAGNGATGRRLIGWPAEDLLDAIGLGCAHTPGC